MTVAGLLECVKVASLWRPRAGAKIAFLASDFWLFECRRCGSSFYFEPSKADAWRCVLVHWAHRGQR